MDYNDMMRYAQPQPQSTLRINTSAPKIESYPILDEMRKSRDQLAVQNNELKQEIIELNKTIRKLEPNKKREIIVNIIVGVICTVLGGAIVELLF